MHIVLAILSVIAVYAVAYTLGYRSGYRKGAREAFGCFDKRKRGADGRIWCRLEEGVMVEDD